MDAQVDTRVTDHRKLLFDSVDDCIAEVHGMLTANDEANLRCTGNWTPGQVMAHVAAWIEYGYEGFAFDRPPFFVRWMLRFGLRKTLQHGMSRGVRIPRVKGGTFGMDAMPIAEAAERLVNALNRLKSDEEAKFDSPGFGAMSHDDRIRLNLRHAELHLGFIAY